MSWDHIIPFLSGGGIVAAGISVWGRIKAKSMDIALEERKQFVKELNELRAAFNQVSQKLNQVMQENGELKLKVQELDWHVTHKSTKLRKLKEVVEEYEANKDKEAFIEKIIELA